MLPNWNISNKTTTILKNQQNNKLLPTTSTTRRFHSCNVSNFPKHGLDLSVSSLLMAYGGSSCSGLRHIFRMYYGFASDTGTLAEMLIFVLYAITMLSIYGGKLPTIIINKTGKNRYAARMQAMLIFALFPLLALFAQPLGNYSYWYPIIIIGIAGAAHQSWSANIYSVVGDMFPKSTIATIVGIGGMAGGIGSFCINMGSGRLFDYAAETNMTFMGFEGNLPATSSYSVYVP